MTCKATFKMTKQGQTYRCQKPKGHKDEHYSEQHGIVVRWPVRKMEQNL
jgi:hypothetical protein